MQGNFRLYKKKKSCVDDPCSILLRRYTLCLVYTQVYTISSYFIAGVGNAINANLNKQGVLIRAGG